MYDFHIVKDAGKALDTTLGYEAKFDFADEKLSGLPILVNKVLKKMLTSEGTDAYAPTTGSNLKTYLQGSNINNALSLTTALNNYIEQISDEIKAGELILSKNGSVFESETRLGNISVSKIENASSGYNSNLNGIIIHLVITNNLGEAAFIKLNASNEEVVNANGDVIIPNSLYNKINKVATGLD